MGRFILALLAFVAVMAILKMIILALIVAGLIFRTKETIGLLMLGGVITLMQKNTVLGIILLAVLILLGIGYAKQNKKSRAAADPLLIEDDPDQE